MGQKAYNPKGQDIVFSINIDFDEAIRGTRKMASFLKPTPCNTCHGSKMAPGTTPEKCSTCDGQGFKNLKQGNMQLRMMCGNCHGAGTIIKQFCGTCKGTGVGSVKQTEEFVIPKGINNGQSLRFVGKGGIGENGAPPGDLILQVNVNPHSYFRREGFNVYTDVYIPISKAVLGGTVNVRTLDGEKAITIHKGMQHGEQVELSNMGVPKLNSTERGNHYITIKVVIPETITNVQAELFRKLGNLEQKIDQEECARKDTSRDKSKHRERNQQHHEEESGDEQSQRAKTIFENLFSKMKESQKYH